MRLNQIVVTFCCQITTILTGVTQERRGVLVVEEYYQTLIDPQALQLDTRLEDLNLLYFSDYGTGYIYSVSGMWRAADESLNH